MATPRAQLPTLRAFLGAIACRKTSTTSAIRGLYSLQGALTETDQDVQDVVNAIVEELETITGGSSVSDGAESSQGTTTDNSTPVQVMLWTPPLATSSNWAMNVRVNLVALATAGGASGQSDGIEYTLHLKCLAGTITVNGYPSMATVESDDFGATTEQAFVSGENFIYACTVAFDISASKLRLRVTGFDASTVVWTATARACGGVV